jgi:tetratricopeptide (TPR) repeat protein
MNFYSYIRPTRLIEINIFLLVAVLSFSSCKKNWLEIKADKKQAIPSTLKDYQLLLDFDGQINGVSNPLGEIASDGHYVLDGVFSTALGNVQNAYTWRQSIPYSQVLSWNETYTRIFYCNMVIEGLKNINAESTAEREDWNNITGQALFLRAEAFYQLSQLYAQPYFNATAHIDVGIPLRLKSDITERSNSSSVKETYDQIIADAKESINCLPSIALYPTRGSKTSALSLLARTYLCMENYDSALTYANKALMEYSVLYDYNLISSSAPSVGLFNPEVIFHTHFSSSGTSNFLTSNCLIDTAHYKLYSDNDLRKSVFFRTNANKTISFKGNYNNNVNQIFCGIATDEIYLIRAECYARKDSVSKAMTDLNTLMVKRWKNNGTWKPFTATNAEEALVQILVERKKELILRGIRWSDLRRLNKDERFKTTLHRTVLGTQYSLSPNSFKYTFPIPNDVIQLSGLTQTPGW